MALTFRQIPGTARRFIGSNGREYSRRQRDNILARRSGFKNRYELEQTRVWVRNNQPDWLKRVRKHTGRMPAWEEYANAKEVRDRRQALIKKHGGTKPVRPWEYDSEDPALVAADGPLANYLDAAGIRKKNDRPVGGS
jgi:hypothetical protein